VLNKISSDNLVAEIKAKLKSREMETIGVIPYDASVFLYEERQQRLHNERITKTKDLIQKRLMAIRENELKEIKNDPEFEDMAISIETCEGFPAEEILSKADELNCDANIMGTHGKGIIANTFLGSTAKRVLRRTRKPVFIIPLPKGEHDVIPIK
jgi:nucleotide-binding universal stress UspA family protein